MALAYTFGALSGLLAAVCLLQMITGRELVRLSKTRRPPGRVRRQYVGPTLIGISGVLMSAGQLGWWAMGLLWGGLILTMVTATTKRRRA